MHCNIKQVHFLVFIYDSLLHKSDWKSERPKIKTLCGCVGVTCHFQLPVFLELHTLIGQIFACVCSTSKRVHINVCLCIRGGDPFIFDAFQSEYWCNFHLSLAILFSVQWCEKICVIFWNWRFYILRSFYLSLNPGRHPLYLLPTESHSWFKKKKTDNVTVPQEWNQHIFETCTAMFFVECKLEKGYWGPAISTSLEFKLRAKPSYWWKVADMSEI